jgi:hypothetical protein
MEGAILGILALMVVVGIVGALLCSLIDCCDVKPPSPTKQTREGGVE